MAFEVVPDELRTHAKHLDALTDRLHTAVDAARSVVMDNAAYGVLCAFLPPIINKTTQDDATEALNAAVEGMTSTADNVKMAAQSYDDTDQANAEPFKKGLADGVGNDGSAVAAKLKPSEKVAVSTPRETAQDQPDGTVNETLERISSLPKDTNGTKRLDPIGGPQPDGTVNDTLDRISDLSTGRTEQ